MRDRHDAGGNDRSSTPARAADASPEIVGVTGWSNALDSVTTFRAISHVVVLPQIISPASRYRVVMVLSTGAVNRRKSPPPLQLSVPAKKIPISLIIIGTPAKGRGSLSPTSCPIWRSIWSSNTAVSALRDGFCVSARRSTASFTSPGEISRCRIRAAKSTASSVETRRAGASGPRWESKICLNHPERPMGRTSVPSPALPPEAPPSASVLFGANTTSAAVRICSRKAFSTTDASRAAKASMSFR